MKILHSDIECLIDLSAILKELEEHPEYCYRKKPWGLMRERVRKVYMMLLNASEKGEKGFEELYKRGIDDDTDAAKAIRTLCPHLN